QTLQLSFSRIQFTPDLMPADILGTTVIDETQHGAKAFEFRRGPIFANIVLADEINRATPKTQSALLEAMQEHHVSVGKKTHALDLTKPFVRFGASPRGAQAVLLAAKIRALFEGRFAASIDDVRASALPALRHRVLLNFEGEAEGMKTDQVVDAILKALPETK